MAGLNRSWTRRDYVGSLSDVSISEESLGIIAVVFRNTV